MGQSSGTKDMWTKNKGRQEGAVIRVDPRFVMKEHLKALEKYEEYKKEH